MAHGVRVPFIYAIAEAKKMVSAKLVLGDESRQIIDKMPLTPSSHVVNYSIHINSHTNIVASSNHITELSVISASACQLVADRLVAFPPRTPGTPDHGMLIRWRNLNTTKSVRSKEAVVKIKCRNGKM